MRRLPLLFALVLPLVFLHSDYQPSVSVGQATLYLPDVAVLAAFAIAVAAGPVTASRRSAQRHRSGSRPRLAVVFA